MVSWQAVNEFLEQWQTYLRHMPTCSADQFIGQGCNCGLRERVERLLARQERPRDFGEQ